MTSDCWQSQWGEKKSILTVREIHRVTNKGHSCSSALGAAWGGILGALSGYPSAIPSASLASPPKTRLVSFSFYRNPRERHRKSQSNGQRCKLEPYEALVTFSLLSNKLLPELGVTVNQQ